MRIELDFRIIFLAATVTLLVGLESTPQVYSSTFAQTATSPGKVALVMDASIDEKLDILLIGTLYAQIDRAFCN